MRANRKLTGREKNVNLILRITNEKQKFAKNFDHVLYLSQNEANEKSI